jgi:glycosyltransferase involved in cell wall biosynthesis
VRIAFVAARWGDPWREEQLFARRVAGALGSVAEIDVLLAGRDPRLATADGAFTVRQFPAEKPDPRRLARLARFTVDVAAIREALSCSCAAHVLEWAAKDVPLGLQIELVRARGGRSPELEAYLRSNAYDAVVLVGLRSATLFALGSLPADRRLVLIPGCQADQALWLPVYDDAFHRADTMLVSTAVEQELVARRAGGDDRRVANVRFALQVSTLSAATDPVAAIDAPYVLAVGDWRSSIGLRRLKRHAELLARALPEVRLVFAGRGYELLRPAGREVAYGTDLRVDLWRWMSRAIAVLDPEPERVLGRDVLEAFLYGVPVLVRTDGGAAREHADAGNGGLWYRNYHELELAVDKLASDGIGPTLGKQGQGYARREYGDAESFRKRVLEACLG